MDLTIYEVIKNIYMGAKSDNLREKFGKFSFVVHRAANKPMIKEAVEKIWNVKVDNVRVMIVKGKMKTFGRRAFRSSDFKKAIVTLKEGYKIDLPQFESMGVGPENNKTKAKKAKPALTAKAEEK